MRLVYCLLCLCMLVAVLPGGPSFAGDEKKAEAAGTAEAVAASFLKAEAAGDKARLDALAKSGNPDPWLVAEALDRLGEREAARRFALRAVRPETAALATCLQGAPDLATQKDAREALDRALAARDPRTALDALKGWPGDARTITAVRILYALGEALGRTGGEDHAASRAAYEDAAKVAEELGWLGKAAQALAEAGRMAFLDDDWQLASRLFEENRRIETRLASAMGRGRAHYALVLAYVNQQGKRNRKKAGVEFAAARELIRHTEDVEYVAKLRGLEAEMVRGDPERAQGMLDEALQLLDDIPEGGLAERFLPDAGRVAETRVRFLLSCVALAHQAPEGSPARARAPAYARRAAREAEASQNSWLGQRARAELALQEGASREVQDLDREADELFEQARRIYAQLRPPQPTRLAYAMRRLAAIHERLGSYLEARDLAEGALEILRTTKSGSAQDLFPALIRCGYIGLHMGATEQERARALFEEALTLASAQKDAMLESRAWMALSAYHHRRVDYAFALDALEQARKACESCPHTEVPGLLYLRFSQLRWHMRQFDHALDDAERAVRVLDGGEQAFILRLARGHFARLLTHAGSFDRAYAILEQLLEAHRARDSLIGQAESLDAMADLRFLQGKGEDDPAVRRKRFEEAQDLRSKALKGFVASGDRRRTIICRSQMGRDLVWAGKDAKGLEQLEQAFREAEALGSPSAQAQCSLGLAEAFHKLDKWAETIHWAERGLELASDYGLDLAEGEGEQMRAGLLSLFHYGAEAALGEDDASVLYRFFDRGRSAVLLAALGGREALATARVGPDLRQKEEQARAKAAEAREAAGRLRPNTPLREKNDAYKAVTAAEDQVREAVMAIRSDVRMQADLAYPDPASLEDVLCDLSPGDALILYGEVSGYLFAVVVSKTEVEVKTKSGVRLETRKETRLVRLGKADPVRTAVQAFLAPEEDEDELGDEKHVTPGLAGSVRQLILEPLALGKDVERLLISPHGILSYVPFSLLDEKREICFLPSGTVLATLRDQQDSDSRGQNVLALGDPDYGTRELLRLPATRAEVDGIADTKRGDKILLDAAASETGFRAALSSGKRWRSVHLACHGKVDREHPRRSFLALAASKEDPDGELQALEVFNMRVPSDLVVLSGCETGGGAVIEGEGLEGLTRAFMFAGAPRVIASLWNVEDDVTQALMVKFYELWNPRPKAGGPERKKRVKGTSPLGAAAALKQAQEFIRTHPDHPEWKHPTYWAAWVLWGLPD